MCLSITLSLKLWLLLPDTVLTRTGTFQFLNSEVVLLLYKTSIKDRHVLELPSRTIIPCLCIITCLCLGALMLSFLTLVFLPVFFLLLLSLFSTFSAFPSFYLPDLKDFQNNKHRYLLASENQRPGNFSTASMGSLTSSPSSCSLNSQVGLTSVTSIQERIMSTPGGEEAIERLKVSSNSESIKVILYSSTRQS